MTKRIRTTLIAALGVSLAGAGAVSHAPAFAQQAAAKGPDKTAAPAKKANLDAKAEERLRAMSGYLSGLSALSYRAQTSTEVVLQSGQKLEILADSTLTARRPDRVRIDRQGELATLTLQYDGKNLSLFDQRTKFYAQAAAPPNLEGTIDFLEDKLDVELPAADLLRKDPYAAITDDVTEGRWVGEATLADRKCDHLAFRGREIDSQLWIEQGDKPLPRRYVITSKKVTGTPEYSVEFRDWNVDPKPSDSLFEFTPPPGATKIQFLALKEQRKAGSKEKKK